jgi:hypothetical protein
MLFSLVGAIFVALKAWVMRVVLGCGWGSADRVEMGGKLPFAAGANLRRNHEEADIPAPM